MKSRLRRTRRTRRKNRTRKYRGGGSNEQSEFIRALHFTIPDAKTIGLKKIVATPLSEVRTNGLETGSQETKRLWNALSAEDKEAVKQRFLKSKGFTLGVYISALENPANSIIFYAEEYLKVLADAADTTPKDILRIIETRGHKTQEELDIIQVAFGDKYKVDGRMELSPSGEILEETYLTFFQ
jgi:hypothetical protein